MRSCAWPARSSAWHRYLVPPLGIIAGIVQGDRALAAIRLAAWADMTIAYRPTARLYRLGAPGLSSPPLALYTAMTVNSAIQHRRGAGDRWKGRVFSPQ